MATAPKPGAQRAEKAALSRLRIRIKDETLEFPLVITMQERFTVRAQTHMSFETFIPSEANTAGLDQVVVWWWLARRHNGEPNLPFALVRDSFPLDLGENDLEIEVIEDDGEATDDPES